ncbi:MAG: glycosyltransferase family 2 protein [Bdellovibrionales bacterium]
MAKINVHVFERLDTNPIPRNGALECRAVSKILNEMGRLPWMLEYYRSLGVNRFFFVDNNSTDGSAEFLARQPDCHVFSTGGSMAQANSGAAWQQGILYHYGESHWWLVIDADELFVYPDCEHIKLPAFCYYLDSIGAKGVSAFMLDMYSQAPVAQAVYRPGRSFLDTCPWFDTEYDFWPRPRHLQLYRGTGHKPWQTKSGRAPLLFPAMDVVGGPRLRVFYPQYRHAGFLGTLKMKVMRNLRDKLKRYKIRIKPNVPPVLFKVPLLRADKNLRLLDCHSVSPIMLAPVTGALLHFKFFSDFHDRVEDAIRRGQHFDGASEYAHYRDAWSKNPNLSFYYEGSAKYENSLQLVKCGLMKDDPSYVAARSRSLAA